MLGCKIDPRLKGFLEELADEEDSSLLLFNINA